MSGFGRNSFVLTINSFNVKEPIIRYISKPRYSARPQLTLITNYKKYPVKSTDTIVFRHDVDTIAEHFVKGTMISSKNFLILTIIQGVSIRVHS